MEILDRHLRLQARHSRGKLAANYLDLSEGVRKRQLYLAQL